MTQENDEFFQMFNLQAIAKDNDGNIVRSSTLNGMLASNELSKRPSVRVDSINIDAEGVKIRAIAKPEGGSFSSGISRVQFFATGVTIDALPGANAFLSDGEQEYILNWKPEEAGVYTLYAMAVGGVGDMGDHYVIGDPLMITAIEEEIASFSTENTPPTVSLINPGINTVSTAVARAELGTLLDDTDVNYTKIVGVKMQSFGYGYSEAPEVLFYGGNGSGAEANASIINGAISKVLLHDGGSDYDPNLTLELNQTTSGDSIRLSATVDDGVLKNIPVLSGGLGYKSTDLINVFDLQNSAYGASGARAIPEVDENGSITQLTLLNGGRNYDANYLHVTIVSTTGLGFEANTTGATIEDGVITSIEILDPGSGYTVGQDYTVTVVAGTGGTGTDLNATISGGDIKDGAIKVDLISQGEDIPVNQSSS